MICVLNEFLVSGDYYVFEVCGDLMKDVGILDGDLVLINCGDSVVNGDIVVVLVDDEEVIFKCFCKKGEFLVVLEVVNFVYEIMIFGVDWVKI